MIILIIIKIKRPNGEAPKFPAGRRPASRGGFGGAEPPRHHHPLQQKNFDEALETLRRPTAGQQGQWGQRPPAHHYSVTVISIIIMTIC